LRVDSVEVAHAVNLQTDSVFVPIADAVVSSSGGCASPFERDRRVEMLGLHGCAFRSSQGYFQPAEGKFCLPVHISATTYLSQTAACSFCA
jgi:hypothetical protein